MEEKLYKLIDFNVLADEVIGHADISEIGDGTTRGAIKEIDGEVATVKERLLEVKMLGWSVPKECPIQNEVNENQFIQKVGRIDLGSVTWSKGTTNTDDKYRMSSKNIASIVKRPLDDNSKINGFCLSYKIITNNATYGRTQGIAVSYATGNVFVYDSNYETTDVNTFKSAMSGVYFYYELATPITMTIDGNEAIEKVNSSLETIGTTTNLLNPNVKNWVRNGVTYTLNDDGSYTLSGTVATSTGYDDYITSDMNLPSGTYKLLGNSNNDASFNVYINGSSKGNTQNNRQEYIFTVSATDSVRISLRTVGNKVYSNYKMYPMLTTNLQATISDFVPFTGSTGHLNSDVAEMNSDVAEISNELESIGKSTTFNITNLPLSTSNNFVSFAKIGNVVVLSGRLQSTDTIPSGSVITSNLPRPAKSKDIIFKTYDTSGNATATLKITDKRELILVAEVGANTDMRFQVAYICD